MSQSIFASWYWLPLPQPTLASHMMVTTLVLPYFPPSLDACCYLLLTHILSFLIYLPKVPIAQDQLKYYRFMIVCHKLIQIILTIRYHSFCLIACKDLYFKISWKLPHCLLLTLHMYWSLLSFPSYELLKAPLGESIQSWSLIYMTKDSEDRINKTDLTFTKANLMTNVEAIIDAGHQQWMWRTR